MDSSNNNVDIENPFELFSYFTSEEIVEEFLNYVALKGAEFNAENSLIDEDNFFPVVRYAESFKSVEIEYQFFVSVLVEWLEERFSFSKKSSTILYEVFITSDKAKSTKFRHIFIKDFICDYYSFGMSYYLKSNVYYFIKIIENEFSNVAMSNFMLFNEKPFEEETLKRLQPYRYKDVAFGTTAIKKTKINTKELKKIYVYS